MSDCACAGPPIWGDNFLSDAAGASAGFPQDASEGAPQATAADGSRWAWIRGRWHRTHTIQSGDTLWNLTGRYYGTRSLEGVRAIHGVPENRAIQGSSPDSGLIPGDRIIIPGLTPPGSLPAQPAAPDEPRPLPAPAPAPGGPIALPPIDDYEIPTELPPLPQLPGDVVVPTPVGYEPPSSPAPAAKKSSQDWILPTAIGLGAVALGTYLVTRKKRKKRRRR